MFSTVNILQHFCGWTLYHRVKGNAGVRIYYSFKAQGSWLNLSVIWRHSSYFYSHINLITVCSLEDGSPRKRWLCGKHTFHLDLCVKGAPLPAHGASRWSLAPFRLQTEHLTLQPHLQRCLKNRVHFKALQWLGHDYCGYLTHFISSEGPNFGRMGMEAWDSFESKQEDWAPCAGVCQGLWGILCLLDPCLMIPLENTISPHLLVHMWKHKCIVLVKF